MRSPSICFICEKTYFITILYFFAIYFGVVYFSVATMKLVLAVVLGLSLAQLGMAATESKYTCLFTL